MTTLTTTTGPEIIELTDERQRREWQAFTLSDLPEMISSMHVCHAVRALADTPLLQRLRSGPRRPADGLLDGLDPGIGPGFLSYLVHRGILEIREGEYFLTRLGEFLTTDVSLARLGVYVDAYGAVTSRIGDLLTGRAVYGKDVIRDGAKLGAHCDTLFSFFHSPVVLRAMQGRGVRRILDIGCGGGQLVIDACVRDPSLTGIGLDISPEAIEVAGEHARRAGVADRVQFVVGDAFAPETWPEVCRDADGLCMMSALHEHFRNGEQAVVDLLDEIAARFPQLRILLIGEPEIRYDHRENDDDFFLIHVLTGQGLPRERTAWFEVFDKSALTLRRVYTRPGAGPRMCFYDLAAGGGPS
ncbi:methyltransferase domain-containing protein [Nocardia sp. CDC159]|uniref:Methyltransferase domain-containing protein n=1 Tax=Nocardia pulmonis TaxID=2951408 RepID=A0A9X2J2Q5_9NOCA|nr:MULTISPECIES: methyltransferase domain-containing protein [Nocardia]MCM6778286.1 methyltransferase domain-containing protein [Nocardia pulmonis]MCM6791175.1 methyltransferase domain-containing protein [Nocardia sp. CDC159]